MIKDYVKGVFIVAQIELKKMLKQPIDIFTRAIQPLIWILIFGNVFNKVKIISGTDYKAFLTPGILTQSVMFVSVFYGITLVWDKDQGQLQRLLCSPIPSNSIILGKSVFSGIRSIIQASAILVFVVLFGLKLYVNVFSIFLTFLAVFLGGMCFSAFSMSIASFFKNVERFMGVIQLITMPLFFSSNALYPVSLMPYWLKILASINPMTYVVNIIRESLVYKNYFVFNDIILLFLFVIVFEFLSFLSFKKIID